MSSSPYPVAPRAHRYHTRSTTTAEDLPVVLLTPPWVLRVPKVKFEMAKRLLTQQPSNGPVTIAEGIPLEEYAKYIFTHPKLPVHICLIGGDVKAYEIPYSYAPQRSS